eukprot:29282-Pelagococcus_subviridis.AAC.15
MILRDLFPYQKCDERIDEWFQNVVRGVSLRSKKSNRVVEVVAFKKLFSPTRYASVPSTAAFVGAKIAIPDTICPKFPTWSKSRAKSSFPGLVTISVNRESSGRKESCRSVVNPGVIKTESTTCTSPSHATRSGATTTA